MLIKCHPRVAYRDCDHCRKWLYNEKDGKVQKKRVGTTKKSELVDVPRGDIPTPCDDPNQEDCAKGHYSNQKSLSLRNAMAYQYVKEGIAVNWAGVPVDSVVRRNASIILDIESNAEKAEHYRMMAQTNGLARLAGGANVNR